MWYTAAACGCPMLGIGSMNMTSLGGDSGAPVVRRPYDDNTPSSGDNVFAIGRVAAGSGSYTIITPIFNALSGMSLTLRTS